jgi:hypothetical protein
VGPQPARGRHGATAGGHQRRAVAAPEIQAEAKAAVLARNGEQPEHRLSVRYGLERLFRDGGPATSLKLVDGKTTSSGLEILTYGPAAGDARQPAIT